MRLKLAGVIACTLAAAGMSFAWAGSRAADHGDGGRETLHLVGKPVDSVFLDLGDTDFSVGDQLAFTNDLYRSGEKIGKDGGVCAVVRLDRDGASTWACTGNNKFPGGQLTVQGLVTYGPAEEFKKDPYYFAITGGTGRYARATGEVKIQESSTGRLQLTFRISS